MTNRRPRLRANDYSALDVPNLGAWAPRLRVSVVIPAFDDQAKLDLALAALAAQTYPTELTEIIVVDDGSVPPLREPALIPKNVRFIPSAPGGWGSAHAVNSGVLAATGDVILRLDADVVTSREHIEAHLRWHHAADNIVVLGNLWFGGSSGGSLDPAALVDAVERAAVADLLGGAERLEPSWVERVYSETAELRNAGSRAFRVAKGASISFPRRLFDLAGGMDAAMPRGSDIEFGYRLAQVGAVFVPDRQARAWHLGPSEMRTDREGGGRTRRPFLAQRVPLLRHFRRVAGLRYAVPLVDVVVEAAGQSYEDVSATALGALNSRLPDVGVTLVGPWRDATARDRSTLTTPLFDLALLHEAFRCDNRVRFVEDAPGSVFPAPYALRCRAGLVPRADALRRLVDVLDRHEDGLVLLWLPPERARAVARLERTASFARARAVLDPGEELDDVVGEISGVRHIDASKWVFGPSGRVRDARDRVATELARIGRGLRRRAGRVVRRAAGSVRG
ncbi:MAG TPA: glycosyltransferase [Micromonosporaceae bacterium]|jgi:glycosyltransferase involved in cell wall biosynthesis